MSRNTHSRQDDHHGLDLDTNVELAAIVGDRYAAGTTLQAVLGSLVARIAALEQFLGVYSIDLSATILKTQTGSLTAGAIACAANGSFPGWEGSFTADAVIQ